MFTALLSHKSGATSICDASFFSKIDPEPFPQTVAWVEGNKGTLELGADLRLTVHSAGERKILDVDPPVPQWSERPWHNVQDSVFNFQSHAMDILSGKAIPQPSGSYNLKTLAVALAAYEAAETGSTIDMSQYKEIRT